MKTNTSIFTTTLPLKKRRIQTIDPISYHQPKKIFSSPLPHGYQSAETRDKLIKRLHQLQRANAETYTQEEAIDKSFNSFQKQQKLLAMREPLLEALSVYDVPTLEKLRAQIEAGEDKEKLKGELLQKLKFLNRETELLAQYDKNLYDVFNPKKTKDLSQNQIEEEQAKLQYELYKNKMLADKAKIHTHSLLKYLTGEEIDQIPDYLENKRLRDIEVIAGQKAIEDHTIQEEEMKRYLDNYRSFRNQFLDKPNEENRKKLTKAEAQLQLAHYVYFKQNGVEYTPPAEYITPDYRFAHIVEPNSGEKYGRALKLMKLFADIHPQFARTDMSALLPRYDDFYRRAKRVSWFSYL